jgi:uncharacterized membrane protein HdeD (DUF308 family)
MAPPSHPVDMRHDRRDSRHDGSLHAEGDISFDQPDRLGRHLFVGPSTKSASTPVSLCVSVFYVSFSCAQTSPNCLFEIGLVRLIEDFTMPEHTPVEIVRHASTLSILWGVLLIVFGILMVGSPFLAAVAVNVVIAWLIILAGVVHVVLAFHAHRAGRLIWKLLVGLAYLFFGAYLIMHPVLGVATLTLVLASLFLIEGILDIVLFFQMRSVRGSSWVLVDGIITLLLGLMIYLQWPSSAVWAIGILVGLSMIISGVTRVMLSLAVRKVAAQMA